MEPRTKAGKTWLQESRGIEKRMRERILDIENEILADLEISHPEFDARRELKHKHKKHGK